MPLRPRDIRDPERLGLMVPEEASKVVAWLATSGSATLSGCQIAVDRGQSEILTERWSRKSGHYPPRGIRGRERFVPIRRLKLNPRIRHRMAKWHNGSDILPFDLGSLTRSTTSDAESVMSSA